MRAVDGARSGDIDLWGSADGLDRLLQRAGGGHPAPRRAYGCVDLWGARVPDYCGSVLA